MCESVRASCNHVPAMSTSFIVSRVAIYEAVAIWNVSATHQHHDLMYGLWTLGKIVPEHGGIISKRQIRCWMMLLSMDEMREFGCIAEEEDGCVVSNHVPVVFFCLELDRKSARVARIVCRTRLSSQCGELDGDRACLALLEMSAQQTSSRPSVAVK